MGVDAQPLWKSCSSGGPKQSDMGAQNGGTENHESLTTSVVSLRLPFGKRQKAVDSDPIDTGVNLELTPPELKSNLTQEGPENCQPTWAGLLVFLMRSVGLSPRAFSRVTLD